MTEERPFVLHGGPEARGYIERHGLSLRDIACIPAAAGGPKGLALIPLDRLLHKEWLRHAGRIELVGASIGAWRMAALAQPDALAALERLQHAYVDEQRYNARPSPPEVSRACRRLAAAVAGDGELRVREDVALTLITARARGVLAHAESRLAFGRAMRSNSLSRRRLALHLERVVFPRGCGLVSRKTIRRVRAGSSASRRYQRPRRVARVRHDPARLRARARHRWRPARQLLGRRADRLPPATALPMARNAQAHRPKLHRPLPALRPVCHAGLARQAPAVAPLVERSRMARQRAESRHRRR